MQVFKVAASETNVMDRYLLNRRIIRFLGVGVVVAMTTIYCEASDQTKLVATLRGKIQLHGMPEDKIPVITAVAIQPDGELVATAGDDHLVRLWNIRTGELLRQLRGHEDWVTSVAFSRDGSELLTGCRDRQVNIWDVSTGRLTGKLGEHQHPITSIVVSQTTDAVAVAGFRAPLKIFDLPTGKQLSSLKCPCTDVRAIAFSPNLQFLAAAGRTGKIRIWNLATSTSQDVEGHSRRVNAMAFADDDSLLSAGDDKAIRLWNASEGKLIRNYRNESGKVLALRLLDDSTFAAATADNVIRLFEIRSSPPLAVLEGHTGSIAALDYRDQTLISGSFDTTVRVWTVGTNGNRAEYRESDFRAAEVSRGKRSNDQK